MATIDDLDLDAALAVATSAAREAGAIIKSGFYAPKDVHEKLNHTDLVTETDQEAERVIKSILQRHYPTHHFIGEEETAALGSIPTLASAPTWMVDPVDGTTNFVHGQLNVCTSIGLVVNKECVVGVVYNPILNELFAARRGGGATCNDAPIHVSNARDLTRSLLATEIGTSRDDETIDAMMDRLRLLVKASRGIRGAGTCAINLCNVASGRVDGMFEINIGGPWDVAAGAVIVTEAGGVMRDPGGGKFNVMSRRVLGAGPGIVDAFCSVVSRGKLSSKEATAWELT